MSATDELRRLLDERGVKWIEGKDPDTTAWYDGSNVVRADEYDGHSELLVERVMTPEQAIAATVGRGECHDDGDPRDFCCSECGVRMFTDTSDTYTMIASDGRTIIKHPNYCPNCGRKVVDE